jgi:ATP-dependent DNA helicase RecG
MSEDSLRDRIASGENQTTEFKAAASLQSIGRSVCGFLNVDGGTIFVGIDDKGQPAKPLERPIELAHVLELQLKKAISPTPFLTTEVVEMNGSMMVVVEVPQGADGPYVFEGGIWLRRDVENKAADVRQLRAIFAKSQNLERWERQLSPGMKDEDLDEDEIRSTVRDAETNRRFAFSDPTDDKLVLRELSVVASGGFTQGGDVLFSRSPGSRHPQCRVQLVAFEGSKSDSKYRDNRWFEGPLVKVCVELINAVSAANPTSSVFEPGEAKRSDRPAYDANALREGLVNAFVHRDYSTYSGGIKISLYPDRMEIWNSGRLPGGLKPKDLRGNHNSILVNPDLAQVFYLRGLMEKIGRGTELIVKASRDLGAPTPQWKDTETGVTLTLFRSHSGDSDHLVNERQRALLEAFQLGEVMTFREYFERFAAGVSDRQARRDLDDLVRARVLARIGSGPATAYKRRRS